MSDLATQRALFERLIARGEEVTEALDHVRAIGDLGTAELDRLVAALGARELPAAATAALTALHGAVERVLDEGDPHRAIDWIGMQPRLVTTLLLGAMNPAALPVDAAQASATRAQGATAVAAQLPTGISFTDAPRDGRAIVYSGIQADPMLRPIAVAIATAAPADRLVARALMNDTAPDAATASAYFSSLPSHRAASDALVTGALAIGNKAAQSNAQYRGAIVEATTAELLRRRPALSRDGERLVRRERRFAVDGAVADPHPYDVSVEAGPTPELWDCKWGARGVDASLLAELEDARIRAAGSGIRIVIGLVIFDSAPVVTGRLGIVHGAMEHTRIITLETLGRLAAA